MGSVDRFYELGENINMNKKIFLLWLLMIGFSYSYWEWTPQTKRWINPKYAVKDTPKEQFEYAEKFRKEGKIDIAIREHRKLLKHYPASEYTPSSCFILAEIYYERGDEKKAFDYYQKIINDYPSSNLVFTAIKRQSEIAEKNLQKKGLPGPFRIFSRSEENAELMNKVIENSPYDLQTPDRIFKLAEFYKDIKEYDRAIEVLDKLIKNFPETEHCEKAKFLKIKYSFLSIPEVSTDTDEIEKIKELIDEFLIEYPETKFKEEIDKIKNSLDNLEAKKYFEIARYYERAGKKKSANYYYRKIVEEFPETEYGKIAYKKINKNN